MGRYDTVNTRSEHYRQSLGLEWWCFSLHNNSYPLITLQEHHESVPTTMISVISDWSFNMGFFLILICAGKSVIFEDGIKSYISVRWSQWHGEVCEGYVFTTVCQSFCSQGGVCLSECGDTYLPWEQTPLWSRHLPGADTPSPPAQCMLGDTGNKWEVRILLECILVLEIYLKFKKKS